MTEGQPEIKVAVCGLGSIGKSVARLLLDHRPSARLTAAATIEPEVVGCNLAEVVGADSTSEVVVAGSLSNLIDARPDVIVMATGSFLSQTADDIVAVAEAGIDLVSPCEELAFPYSRFAAEAKRIDEAAKKSGATVLGTGINPGFIFDGLLAVASGAAWDVESIRGRRVVDVVGFGQNIHLRLGIGYTLEEFEAGHSEGRIAGHVGFPESIEMIAERLGWALDGPVEESFEPMIAETAAPTNYGEVAAGKTEGFLQRAVGRVGGEARIELELILHLRPAEDGMEAADSFEIAGIHPVNLTLSPGMDAIPATSAVLVNSIPGLVRAPAGLLSVKDLPAASAWLDRAPGQLLR